MKNHEKNDKTYLISDLPVHERPRERLLKKGAEALSDIELIAIILRSGPHGQSTLDLAKDLLRNFDGNLNELASATPDELGRVKGIGKAKAAELKATFSLATRLAAEAFIEKNRIHSPEDAANYLREIFRGKKQEELRILLLSTKNIVLKDELITVGLVDRSQAHAREVFRAAIIQNATKVILAHNHPSGDPAPSNQDISCTSELVASGKIIGIEVADHIILGQRTNGREKDFFSFRENSLIQ